MNIPTSVEAITVIVLIFIPGYIFLQFTKGAVAFVPQTVDARYFFAVITWGGLIHVAAVYWTAPIIGWYQNDQFDEHMAYVFVWAILTLVVGPLGAGILGAWFIQLPWIDKALGLIAMDYVSRTPSAWNYAVKAGPRWVKVHLKDGTVIGGVYEDSSFADDTDEQDLFLERVYNLTDTGDFADPVQNTAGVWIPHDVMSHVMFFGPGQGGETHAEENGVSGSETEAGLGTKGDSAKRESRAQAVSERSGCCDEA